MKYFDGDLNEIDHEELMKMKREVDEMHHDAYECLKETEIILRELRRNLDLLNKTIRQRIEERIKNGTLF